MTKRVTLGLVGLMMLSGVMAGCSSKKHDEEIARMEAASSRAEAAANKAEMASKSAADAAARAAAAADRAEAVFKKTTHK